MTVRQDRLCTARAFETARLTALIGAAAVLDRLEPAIGRMLVRTRDHGLPYILTVTRLMPELPVFDRPWRWSSRPRPSSALLLRLILSNCSACLPRRAGSRWL